MAQVEDDVERSVPTSATSKDQRTVQNMLCAALFVLAYISLVPGLCMLLFSGKAEVDFFGIHMTVWHLEKSTLGTVKLLYESTAYVPMLAILVFSVTMPFVKLFAMLFFAAGKMSDSMLCAIKKVSTWATIDAFAAAALVAFFDSQNHLHVDLRAGFYCFLTYCILSTAASLLLHAPQSSLSRHATLGGGKSTVVSVIMICIMVLLLHQAATWPILKMQSKKFSMVATCSTWDLVCNLWKGSSTVAGAALVILTMAVPACDFSAVIAQAVGFHVDAAISQWLEQFAMLDVWALSLVIMRMATSGINHEIGMELLPAGWMLSGFSACWVLFNVSGRPGITKKISISGGIKAPDHTS